MIRSRPLRRSFYVVQFIELPFEGIDDYVCVPYSWLVVRRHSDQKAVVPYPKGENPFDTRDRVKRKERYNDEWERYMAVVKYESDSYSDAEFWIATRNDYGPLVEEESRRTDTMSPLNKNSLRTNLSYSLKSNFNPRKPLLIRISIKRRAPSEPSHQLKWKRLNLDEAAQSSSTANDTNPGPNCSTKEQSIITKNRQPIQYTLSEKTAAASNGNDIEQNEQALSLKDVDEPTEVINIDDEDRSPNIINTIQSHLSEVTTAASITPEKPSTSAKHTSQPYHHINRGNVLDGESSSSNLDRIRIENVRSIANVSNDDELGINRIPNSTSSTSNGIECFLKMSDHLYRDINQGRRLVPIQKPVERRIRLIM